MKTAWWVALGSGIGGVARVGAVLLIGRMLGVGFPHGILAVNLLGSFAIGWIAAVTAVGGALALSANQRQFLMAGICGGFTTYSLFVLGTLEYWQEGEFSKAGAYIFATIGGCMIAVWVGHVVGASRWSRPGSRDRPPPSPLVMGGKGG